MHRKGFCLGWLQETSVMLCVTSIVPQYYSCIHRYNPSVFLKHAIIFDVIACSYYMTNKIYSSSGVADDVTLTVNCNSGFISWTGRQEVNSITVESLCGNVTQVYTTRAHKICIFIYYFGKTN